MSTKRDQMADLIMGGLTMHATPSEIATRLRVAGFGNVAALRAERNALVAAAEALCRKWGQQCKVCGTGDYCDHVYGYQWAKRDLRNVLAENVNEHAPATSLHAQIVDALRDPYSVPCPTCEQQKGTHCGFHRPCVDRQAAAVIAALTSTGTKGN